MKQERALVIIAILTSGVREVEKYLKQITGINGKLNYVIFE